jgi:GTP pyrophosphokinase
MLAKKFRYPSVDALFAMLGSGDLSINQIINATIIKPKNHVEIIAEQIKKTAPAPVKNVVNDLLSHAAKCCKPIPGDDIIGYITIGHGVSIHRHDCANMVYAHQHHADRLMPITWDIDATDKNYLAEIEITSHNRVNLLKDITGIFSNEKINLARMNSLVDTKTNQMKVNLAIEVTSTKHLQKIISKLQQLPDIIKVIRT